MTNEQYYCGTERAVQILIDADSVPGLDDLLMTMSVEQIEEYYGLRCGDASFVWQVLHDNDPDRSTYRLTVDRAGAFLQMVQESIHQGHDGYTAEGVMAIRAFLSDITYAINTDV